MDTVTSTKKEQVIWEEKKSAEPEKNCSNSIANVQSDIMIDINREYPISEWKSIMRICTNCKFLKKLNDFYKDSQFKDGHRRKCKLCELKIRSKWRNLNRTKIRVYSKCFSKNNPDFRRKRILQNKAYKQNPNNKEKLRIKKRERLKRYALNPKWRIIHNLRGRVYSALKRQKKFNHSMKLFGCDRKTLLNHLESQFKPNMTWNNYGIRGWHVDHIKPCTLFDLSIPDEQYKCFNYNNLQPLWWYENIRKGNRFNL